MNNRKIRPPDHPAEGATNNEANNTIIPIVRNLRSFSVIMTRLSLQLIFSMKLQIDRLLGRKNANI